MTFRAERVTGPHAGTTVVAAGARIDIARAVLIVAHGRGGRAADMLSLAEAVAPPDVAVYLPQATDYSWYPQRFMAPLASNEPWLTSALDVLNELVARADTAGIPKSRVVFAGFSQGACLVLEWAARHAAVLGGVAGLSGGLIGPDDSSRDYIGRFDGTPVLLGCSDVDAHIPVRRVRESAEIFTSLGALVDLRIYPSAGHAVNDDEITALRAIVERVLTAGTQ